MTTNNNDEVLVHKLFDQLEKALNRVDDELSTLREAISEMLDILKHSTTNEDVIKELNDHSKKVIPTINVAENIYTKCEEHGKSIDGINKKVVKLSGWVRNMILVVTIAFSLITATYLFTKSSVNSIIKTEIKRVVSNTTQGSDDIEDVKLMIKEIQKELIKQKELQYLYMETIRNE